MDIIRILETSFRQIKQRGFIQSQRPNNRDGGIGNTFEDLLGVTENNLSEADFLGFEVKSQRELTSSVVSLFSKCPSYPKNANSFLKDTYGEIRDDSNSKKLYASVFGHRTTFVYEKYLMRLVVIDQQSQLKLVITDKDGTTINDNIYWTFDELKKSCSKLRYLLYVSAKTKKENHSLWFHYNKAELFFEFNFESFIEAINVGDIQFDLRIGVHKSGKNIGKTHDHGSGFRIASEKLPKLFKTHKIIE